MTHTRSLSLSVLLAGCLGGPRPDGLAPTVATGGPVVRYDVAARPLPEIPLPNDAATRLDPGSPTGRRLNVSQDAPTAAEREMREKFDRLDGFGAYAPIVVAFDKPLDLVDLQVRHRDDDDFRNDAVYLLNVDRDCARFGEEIAVDMGRGRFPLTSYRHADLDDDPLAPGGQRWNTYENNYFPFDTHSLDNNLLFSETNEDVDDDGLLDDGEDLDDDGVLDVANFVDPHACDGLARDTVERDRCVADNLITFYERETNTLILRPLWPMEERCTHAVVLTRRLVGEDGSAVTSPFPGVNHTDQTAALAPVPELLSRYDLSVDDVGFAWTFTVGTMTGEIMALREGLYGSGPFAQLADAFPVSGMHLWTRAELGAAFDLTVDPAVADDTFLPGACASASLTTFIDEGYGEWGPNMCALEADTSAVSAWFGGTFTAPNLLVDKDGGATDAYPDDQDELWKVDLVRGEAVYGSTDATFFCALPVEDPNVTCAPGNPDGVPFCKPFPTVIFSHGYGSYRAEFAYHMGRHAAMGQAACSVDSYGHGLTRATVDPLAGAGFRSLLPSFVANGTPELAALLVLGRDRDLNNDGLPESGADQWTADIFHTRDMVRQSALEIMQLVRMLRHMDGTTKTADGGLLGDVDGDGVVDLGGPQNTIGHWGISLGGIISGVLAGAEPSLDAASPNAGGAGLTDVSMRANLGGLPEAIGMPMIGQLVAVCLPTDGHDNPLAVGASGGDDCHRGRGRATTWTGGTLRVALYNEDTAQFVTNEVGAIEGVLPGDTLVVTNLVNGQEVRARITDRGWARVGIAADALDAIEKRQALGWGDTPGPFSIDDPTEIADAIEVRVERDGQVVGVLDTFQHQITYQGGQYEVGTPLTVLQQGFGYGRNSPDMRRLIGFAQHGVAPADPGVWSQHYWMYPLDVSAYDPFDDGSSPRALVMPTVGDSTVPASAGANLGRTSGLLGSWVRDPETFGPEVGWREVFAPDPRYGKPPEQWLIDQYVFEGDARFERFPDTSFNKQTVFDPDNLSDGTAEFSCGGQDWSGLNGENRCPDDYAGQDVFFPVPHPAPGDELRATRTRDDGTHDAFRFPLLRPAGQHGIYNAQSFRQFDADAYAVNFTARFLGTRGAQVTHESGCDCSTDQLPNVTRDGAQIFPALGEACTTDAVKVCSATCAQAWGLQVPDEAVCLTE